jgi:hypothetical protein
MQGKIRIRREHIGGRCFFSALLVIMMAASLLIACSSCTSYYATFSRRVKQLDFTFEYPREWETNPLERYPDLIRAMIYDRRISDNESPVKVDFNVWLGLGPKAEQEARDKVSETMSSLSKEHNFSVIRQESITLDGNGGYAAEYTYDAISSYEVPPEMRFYVPTRVLNITIPRHGMVYQISISASQNEWNAHQKDIQHILDTFR